PSSLRDSIRLRAGWIRAGGRSEPAPGHGADPRRGATGRRAPDSTLTLEPVADHLDDQRLRSLQLIVGDRDAVEDPAGQHLLDGAVEGERRELGRDLGAEDSLVLRLSHDRGALGVGVANLAEMRAA